MPVVVVDVIRVMVVDEEWRLMVDIEVVVEGCDEGDGRGFGGEGRVVIVVEVGDGGRR